MAEVTVLGQDMNVPGGRTTLAIGLGAVLLWLLVLRPRAAGTSGGNAVSGGGGVPLSNLGGGELANVAAEASADLARLTSMNRLEEKRLAYQYRIQAGMTPGSLRQCIPWETWLTLPKETRDNLTRQAQEGAVLLSATGAGMCLTPTTAGIGGHAPYSETKTKRGFFSSTRTMRSPGASYAADGSLPDPTVNAVLADLLPALLPAGQPAGVPA